MVDTIIGSREEYKHLVNTTHEDDSDFDSVINMVLEGYKMTKRDWEQGFVDIFVATEAIGERRKTKDKDEEHEQDLDHDEAKESQKDEENQRDEENQNDKEDHKDEEYEKDKEQRKDEGHSKSNSEKLDELIEMVQGLGKRVKTIQKFLGINVSN